MTNAAEIPRYKKQEPNKLEIRNPKKEFTDRFKTLVL